jgi:serine/threonine protein kinase
VLKVRGGAQALARARLKREALAKLAHPNVVGVHDVGDHAGELFVAMEFVEGQTLGEWMKSVERPRPWREVLRVFLAAGRGLAAAHGVGLVHRDVKPDNIMLGVDHRVRVMDFGLARAAVINEGADEGAPAALPIRQDPSTLPAALLLDSRVTQTGALLGTPAYMAYELFVGAQADPRSDQFGFCVALYEALYGRRPFEGDNVGQLMAAVMRAEIPDPPKGTTVPTRRVVVERRPRRLDSDRQ